MTDKLAEENESSAATTEEMIAALQGRASFYDLLAALYYNPLSVEQIDNIAALDFSAYAQVNELLAEGFNDISRYLRRRNTGTRQELAVDFTSAFAGVSSWKGAYSVPYESVFTSDKGLMYQEAYHEVHHTYKHNNVARQEGYDYPDDHLSFMCEFLVILSNRTIEALEAGDKAVALENIQTSRQFLQEHILSWFDSFADLAQKLITTRFYRGILKVSKGFFLFDAETLDELAEELSQAAK